MLSVIIAPDERLRVKTKKVKKINNGLLILTADMIKLTQTFVDPEGVGLASTQVGKDEQFFIALIGEKKYKAFFNPKIVAHSKKPKAVFEGCLSVPNYWGEVERYPWVKVT